MNDTTKLEHKINYLAESFEDHLEQFHDTQEQILKLSRVVKEQGENLILLTEAIKILSKKEKDRSETEYLYQLFNKSKKVTDDD